VVVVVVVVVSERLIKNMKVRGEGMRDGLQHFSRVSKKGEMGLYR
jgi:hypothetical protein